MYKISLFDKLSFILLIIGGLNWGLLGLFNFNLVQFLFGEISAVLVRIIYILVGVSALNIILFIFKSKKVK